MRSAIVMSQMCADYFPWGIQGESSLKNLPYPLNLPPKVLLLMSTKHY